MCARVQSASARAGWSPCSELFTSFWRARSVTVSTRTYLSHLPYCKVDCTQVSRRAYSHSLKPQSRSYTAVPVLSRHPTALSAQILRNPCCARRYILAANSSPSLSLPLSLPLSLCRSPCKQHTNSMHTGQTTPANTLSLVGLTIKDTICGKGSEALESLLRFDVNNGESSSR